MAKTDLMLLTGVLIIIFGLSITTYMPLNFYFNRYLSSKHDFEEGSRFIYFGALPGVEYREGKLYRYVFKLEIIKRKDNLYSVETTLFLWHGEKLIYNKNNIPFASSSNLSLIFTSSVLVDEDEGFMSTILFPDLFAIRDSQYYVFPIEEPFAVYAKPGSIGYVKHYIALPRNVAEMESPFVANRSIPPLLYMYYKVGDRYILYNAVLNNMSFIESLIPMTKSLNQRAMEKSGFIELIDTNTIPSDQDWFYALQYEFAIRLYPLPLVLCLAGVILIIIRFRQGG